MEYIDSLISVDTSTDIDPQKLLLIFNPVSGRKNARKYLPEIIRTFTSAGYLVTTFVTGAHDEALHYTRIFGGKFDRIVCVGGDGTLNEVVTGIQHGCHDVPVGYIPSGSTNDFATCHGLSSNVLAAARDAASGVPAATDIGRFNSGCFTYVAAFGAFSWLSYSTSQNLKNILGHTAYILDGIKDLPMIKPIPMKVDADGIIHEGSYIFGAVSNSTSIAGVITLPEELVDMHDGQFEVLLVKYPATALELQNIITSVINQEFESCPLIEFFRAKHLVFESDNEVAWTNDGEFAGESNKNEMSVIPGGLKIVTNK